MTNEEKKHAIESYIAAYNSLDVDGMVSLLHPEVIFKNVAGGDVNAQTVGVEQFRELATQSKAIFSSRHQKATNFMFPGDIVTVDIAYEGVLAADLLNGMKSGEVL
jgi:hypothetical protein